MKKIILKANPKTGEIKIETKGFSGPECIEASKFLEKALGKVIEEKKTAEYYKVSTENKIKNRQF